MPRAASTACSLGANAALAPSTCPGWMRVLPSKPISRPWAHSARKPSVSWTSLKTPSRIAVPVARAASSASDRPVSSGARPGTCSANSSLARSLVPITSTDRRSEAAAISSCPSGEQRQRQTGEQRGAAGHVLGEQLLGQVVGPHHQHGQAIGGGGDLQLPERRAAPATDR